MLIYTRLPVRLSHLSSNMKPFRPFCPLAGFSLMAGLMNALADYVTASVNPGIFEVDLLFPRNATYTPQPLMPIVWALQNPPLVSPLGVTIYWNLWEGTNQTSPGSLTDGVLEPYAMNNLSSSEPILLNRFFNTISYPDGVWTLAWSVQVTNCSQAQDSTHVIELNNTIVFATSSSGQAPNLVAATKEDMCSSAEAFAFDITSISDEGLCSAFGPSPTINPCAATIDATAASSISAAATAKVCLPGQPPYPNVTCPTPTFALSADAAGRSRLAAASTLLMLLASLTTLIHRG